MFAGFLQMSENEFFHKIKRDGITSLHGIHVVIPCLTLSMLVPDWFHYGNSRTCWIAQPNAILYVFAFPILMSVSINIICLIVCVTKLTRHNRGFDQSSLRSNQLVINFKLSLLTGSTWLFGFLPYLTGIQAFWYPFVVLNSLQGLFILIAFGLTKRTLTLFYQRFCRSVPEEQTQVTLPVGKRF